MEKRLQRLIDVLYARSFGYDPKGGYLLSSGKRSDVYIDVKKTVLSAEGMELTGRAVYERIKNEHVDGIGGLTLGADPIAYAGALISGQNGKSVEVFIVRKEPKKHGLTRAIEGNLDAGSRVVIIEDVITTGASTLKAIESSREAGFEIIKVLALVDRQEGGSEEIKRASGCEVEAIFTKKNLLDIYQKQSEIRG